MDNKFYISEIKNRITMPQLLQRYGFDISRRHRIACPFHKGHDKNLGFKDDFFKCFVCGESGDVIHFAQLYFEMSFQDTIIKLNQDFALGLPIGEQLSLRQVRNIQSKAHEIAQKRKDDERERERLRVAYENALDEWVRLDRDIRIYKPKNTLYGVSMRYCDALFKINEARQVLDEAEMRLYLYEHR